MASDSIAIVLSDFSFTVSQSLVAELNTELTGQYTEPRRHALSTSMVEPRTCSEHSVALRS